MFSHLRITKEPTPETRAGLGIEGWIAEAEILGSGKMVFQSVFAYDRGLLQVSYEAPNTPEFRNEYDRFVRSLACHEAPEAEPEGRTGAARFGVGVVG